MNEQEAINTIKAKAVMEFVDLMIGAFASGFVDTPKCTIGQVYQVARNHVSDSFGIETLSLSAQMGKEFADECNPKD